MNIWLQLKWFAAQVEAPEAIKNTSVKLDNTTLPTIFNAVLGIAAAVAVAFIVFGGIKYVLSRGEPDEIKQARDTILYAIIGLIVVVVSFMLVNFVIGKF